jgi:adhesin transport system membrane fusion protein
MLNISENTIDNKGLEDYSSFKNVSQLKTAQKLAYWVIFFFVMLLITIMLPWTQNIVAKGKVTTLRPEHRPQSVYSTISGKIEKWYVREGQSVKKGDTLAFLAEVKSEYFDPNLLGRTKDQVNAKQSSRTAYSQKLDALTQQLAAIEDALIFKLEQNANKVKQYYFKATSDSIAVNAAKIAYQIATYQFNRTDTLFQKGIKSLTSVEDKRNKMQGSEAKLVACENKYLSTKNELLNAQINLNGLQSEYADKMAKVRSEQSSALSSVYDAESQIAKLENQYSNYEQRATLYHIIAPQDGYITKIYRKGIGELVKETDPLLSIMPTNYQLAVETYIRPMDYPLLKLNQEVRFVFDGWPAFVFSGWPNQSYGTFVGKVIAIDNVANEKGMYRILVSPNSESKPWPDALRVGAGASTLVMLNNVPLWYEFWRQLNGFPPDFYDDVKMDEVKLKAPMNHLKKG